MSDLYLRHTTTAFTSLLCKTPGSKREATASPALTFSSTSTYTSKLPGLQTCLTKHKQLLHSLDQLTRSPEMEALVLSNFLNQKYSDLTIMCDGEVFPAHRNIVCPQSTSFKVACDGRFKEGDGKISLNGQDPMLVKKTLEFFYTGNYTYEDPLNDSLSKAEIELFSENEAETSMANPRTGEAYFHAQMYAQGDYFQIDALKSKAKQCFEESFMMGPFDGDSFTSAVIEVYSSTAESDRGLRDLLVQLTINKLYLLRASRNLILDDNLLERVPSFMRDICVSALDRCDEFQREAEMRGGWDDQECSSMQPYTTIRRHAPSGLVSEGASQSTSMSVHDNW